MRSQAGFSLVETVVAVGLLAVVAGGTAFAVRQMLWKSQVSRAASRLVDGITLARTRSVATHTLWRIAFDPPDPPNSEVTQGFVLQACAPDCSTPPWEKHYEIKDGLGLKLPRAEPGFVDLRFTQAGRYAGSTLTIDICSIQVTNGIEECETIGATVKIHANTGRLEY
jgi:prepilin-type N-terminal cleavage/methylation domain-containing protein